MFGRQIIEFSVNGPVPLVLDEGEAAVPGCASMDINFSQPSQIGEIVFQNYFTAWITVLVRYDGASQKDQVWKAAVMSKVLMPSPHNEKGCQDVVSITANESHIHWRKVVTMRLILHQPSSVWRVFNVEVLNVFRDLPSLAPTSSNSPSEASSCSATSSRKLDGVKADVSLEASSTTAPGAFSAATLVPDATASNAQIDEYYSDVSNSYVSIHLAPSADELVIDKINDKRLEQLRQQTLKALRWTPVPRPTEPSQSREEPASVVPKVNDNHLEQLRQQTLKGLRCFPIPPPIEPPQSRQEPVSAIPKKNMKLRELVREQILDAIRWTPVLPPIEPSQSREEPASVIPKTKAAASEITKLPQN